MTFSRTFLIALVAISGCVAEFAVTGYSKEECCYEIPTCVNDDGSCYKYICCECPNEDDICRDTYICCQSKIPTALPTTMGPRTKRPTVKPTWNPNSFPSKKPAALPTTPTPTTNKSTAKPTRRLSSSPSKKSTDPPTIMGPKTRRPTVKPNLNTSSFPSKKATALPTTPTPTWSKTTAKPTRRPGSSPSKKPMALPTTAMPTTSKPTNKSTHRPSSSPSKKTTALPTTMGPRTRRPNVKPTLKPNLFPLKKPTALPTSAMPRTRKPAVPTLSPSSTPKKSMVAVYNAKYQVPMCESKTNSCWSGTLLDGRASLGSGEGGHSPNTINGGCSDGSGGVYHVHESLDSIKVSSISGGVLTTGEAAEIEAVVWAVFIFCPYCDHADFYYAIDAKDPEWKYIGSVDKIDQGAQSIKITYTLPLSTLQAVRVVFRYGGEASGTSLSFSCPSGKFDDVDDLVFSVKEAPPLLAVYSEEFQVPMCESQTNSCWSGTLLDGRVSLGSGEGGHSPNTLNGVCSDGSGGAYHVDESLDSIKVSSISGGVLTAGETAEIEAVVWADPSGTIYDSADFYYAINAENPEWKYIGSVEERDHNVQTIKITYTLPLSALQAVRVVFRYGGEASGTSLPFSCPLGVFDDVDDLVFSVMIAPPSVAVYSEEYQVPMCESETKSCWSGTLLDGRASLGSGEGGHSPNTINGGCSDGSGGVYHKEESLDSIKVSSISGGVLTTGEAAEIEAVVWAYPDDRFYDYADFYYAIDAENPEWKYIGSVEERDQDLQSIKITYTLPLSALQAVRVVFRYGGEASGMSLPFSCPVGVSDDVDDLVFSVMEAPPSLAVYSEEYQVPMCEFQTNSCWSGTLLDGRASLGSGEGGHSPNTLSPWGCWDRPYGKYHVNESLDSIKVSSISGDFLTTGEAAEIEAVVWADPDFRFNDYADFYYAIDAKNPEWKYIGSVVGYEQGVQSVKITYTLPLSALQAVRVVYRYGGEASGTSLPFSCPVGVFDDVDDLVFSVMLAPPSVAVYSEEYQVPMCESETNSCWSGLLLDGRATLGSREGGKSPNTIDWCYDGSGGVYHKEESLDSIKVSSISGRVLTAGETAEIEAVVWAYPDGRFHDYADFYYAVDAKDPEWKYIGSVEERDHNVQTIKITYTLPLSALQAVRVVFRYGGEASGTLLPFSCPSGKFDDVDDLVFSVMEAPPSLAVYSAEYQVPMCESETNSCWSGTLLDGRASLGSGEGGHSPNTLNGDCRDGSHGEYHVHESLDSIKVSSISGGVLTTGEAAEIEAVVWAYPVDRFCDYADFYYAIDAENPEWKYIDSVEERDREVQSIKITYTLPLSALQAVRVVFRYGGEASGMSLPFRCPVGVSDDVDDLVFSVRIAPPSVAVYSGEYQVPMCEYETKSCWSGLLLDGRASLGPGEGGHSPNTLNGDCSDGSYGVYHVDESLDSIRVYSISGHVLTAGETAEIEAVVWADPCDDVDFYYAIDAKHPDWKYIGSVQECDQGVQSVKITYTLPLSALQAVRVVLRYKGEVSGISRPFSCPVGDYDDVDDLVFSVKTS